MSRQKLDDIDLQLIGYLARDGRMSGRQLSHLLPISEGTSRLRLRGLLSSVVSVKALVNPSKVGFPMQAILTLKVQPGMLDSVVARLTAHEQVTVASPVAGAFDVIALAMFRSARNLTTVAQDFIGHIHGVRDVQVNVCLETQRGYFTTLVPDLLTRETLAERGIDEVDVRMITYLAENGRLSSRELAHRLSIGEISARNRLKRLVDDGVITIRALVDPSKVGFSLSATMGLKVELSAIRSVALALAAHPQICYVSTCAGAFDIVMTAVFRSHRDLRTVLQDFVSRVEGVKETQTFICMDESGFFTQLVPPPFAPALVQQ